jgi:hypothetical protein
MKTTYYVNKRAQNNGDNEVHKDGCSYLPAPENRSYLGEFEDCHAAVKEARKTYPKTANGCAYCCPACHTR